MTTRTHTVPSMPIGSMPDSPEAGSIASRSWAWLAPYVVIIFVLLVLGSLLGDLSLFKRVALGTPKLTASELVKFFAYSGALVMVWLIAQRSTLQLREQGGKTAFLGGIALAVAVLVIVSCGYSVLLIVLRSLMESGARDLYDWLFVLGITACALWLVVMLFRNSDPIIELFKADGPAPSKPVCRECSLRIATTAQFCPACGKAVS